MRFFLVLLLIFPLAHVGAQQQPLDSTQQLTPVVIEAYSTGRPLIEVPAAIGSVTTKDLNRFSNTNLLPAINTIPGVRMEERSPGSYRFSIRGSLMRSPFGVRNVKAYWNGLPLTDGGGNTYLNLLDFGSIGSVEVIKGPAGSLYGAGTGGAVILKSPLVRQDQWEFEALVGSYGLSRYALSQQFHNKKFTLRLHFASQQSAGYREQSEMKRYSLNGDLLIPVKARGQLSATFFYTNLTYETPGGLSQTQYEENPQQARPAAGTTPGAAEQKATVYNQTPYLGLNYDHDWNQRWSTRLGIFGSRSDFANPTVRNYEERDEKNAGARTETQMVFGSALENTLTFGGEFQYFTGPLTVYDNLLGEKGAIQTDDDLSSSLSFVFAQADFQLRSDFFVTVGGSVNFLKYDLTRNEPAPLTTHEKPFDPFFSPRIALLKKLNEKFSAYANVSRGFSPPTLAEVRPSTNAFNESLNAERGTNYEVGLKGATFKNRFAFDIAFYDFSLRETIVIQRLDDGADYFINAGETSQRGIEAQLTWRPIQGKSIFVSDFTLWTSHTYNHYRFEAYVNDNTDYSGNMLTGVPPTTNVSGLDVRLKKKVYANLTANYVDPIPLNDANDVYADSYFLVGGRFGYTTKIKGKHVIDGFAGIDNALDRKYSLGNDLNAVFGGRYFNAAAPRNFYVGVRLTLVQ